MLNLSIESKLLKCVLIVIAVGLVWPADSCLAGKKEAPLPAHYPEEFTIVNCIERVDSDKILMGDSLYRYARKVRYYVPESTEPTSRSRFRPGRMVGLIMNSSNEIESMWLIDKCR